LTFNVHNKNYYNLPWLYLCNVFNVDTDKLTERLLLLDIVLRDFCLLD